MSRQNDLPTLDGAKESTTPSSSLYVDTENLQDASRTLVEAIVGSWPERAPPPSRLRLYVQADNVQLWEVWASDRFPQLTVVVHGVQHFTKQSKNAADMALALDAIADFVAGTTQFVVVMSDDSDFMSVFLKLRELANDPAPFLWVMTDRASTKTPVAAGYLPSSYLHTLVYPERTSATKPVHPKKTADTRPSTGDKKPSPKLLQLAEAIIEEMPAGSFKASDCQSIIKSRWPNAPMVTMSSANFGTEFANRLFPILRERGIEQTGSKPRKYQMPESAKNP